MNNVHEGLPVWAAIAAVLSMEIVALAIGFLAGTAHGARQARIRSFHQCIDWAALAMKGHPGWRALSADCALTKAGCLIAGDDLVVPPVPTVTQVAAFTYESAAAAKGRHE